MITKIQRYLLIGSSMMIVMQLFPSQKIEWKDSMLFSLLCIILVIAFDTSCMANNNYKYENLDNTENFEFSNEDNFPTVKSETFGDNLLDEPQFNSKSQTPPQQQQRPTQPQQQQRPTQQQQQQHNNDKKVKFKENNPHSYDPYVRKDDLDAMVDRIMNKLNDVQHSNTNLKKKNLGDYIDKSWPQTQEEQQYNLLHTDNWTPSRTEMVRAKTGDCEVCPVEMYQNHLPVLNFDKARKVLGNDIDEYRKKLDH